MNSSYFEGVCSSRRASTCSQRSPSPLMTDDLPDLLSQLGLIKYIDVFEQQEVNTCKVAVKTTSITRFIIMYKCRTLILKSFLISSQNTNAFEMSVMQLLSILTQIDYQTFLTLSDEDLKEVGVSTFGARRKMLIAISGENLLSCGSK